MSRQWNSVRIADAIGSIESAASTGALKRALMGVVMGAALGFAGGAAAQDAGAAGLWRTIDDETKQPKALVRITESGGVLSGRIEKLFNPSKPAPVCEACTDDRKGRPIEGMTILTGLKPVGDGWGGGGRSSTRTTARSTGRRQGSPRAAASSRSGVSSALRCSGAPRPGCGSNRASAACRRTRGPAHSSTAPVTSQRRTTHGSLHRQEGRGAGGAGVMGAQIAAHLANAGVPSLLFDLPAKEGPARGIAIRAIEGLKKMSPAPLGHPDLAEAISPASYEDDLARLAECDLVIEAIAERMDWKHDLYRKVAPHLAPGAIFATNTSGLSITGLAAGFDAALRSRFCGVHFFNPPRYMHLVELIPTADTDPAVLDRLEGFLTSALGKGVVRAKDTPNFIGNRIGIFSILSTFREAETFGLPVDVVDDLTGDKLGRAKSGTFRTADVVGLDTMAHVIRTMQDNLQDSFADLYRTPAVLQALIAKGALGSKTGAGFYRKVGKDILRLDPARRLRPGGRQGRRDRCPHPEEEDLGGTDPVAPRVEESAGAVRLGDPAQHLSLRGADAGGDRGHGARRRLLDALGFRPEAGTVRDLAAGRLERRRRLDRGGHRRRPGVVADASARLGRRRSGREPRRRPSAGRVLVAGAR